jgi:hypothetical protein
LGIRKSKRNDIEWFNSYGNQITHFIGCTKRPNAENFYCNYKKIGTTFDVGLIICVLATNEGKTQARWVVVVGQRMWKWAKTNNILPNGSPYHVLILMKWLWNPHVGNFKKHNEDGHA